MEPDEVQARVVLVAALFKLAMPRVAHALVPMPPRAETKERLFAALEEGAWKLPDETFADFDGDEAWGERAAQKPAAKVLLERAIQLAVSSQPR